MFVSTCERPLTMQQVDLPDSYARFRFTWSKLRAFSLVEYERIVFLDSDVRRRCCDAR